MFWRRVCLEVWMWSMYAVRGSEFRNRRHGQASATEAGGQARRLASVAVRQIGPTGLAVVASSQPIVVSTGRAPRLRPAFSS
jgi:hypothetical protein